MKLDDGRLTFVAQQEVTALDAIHKAALGKAACAGRVTEGVGTCISIHALTWGATGNHPLRKWDGEISIHAPTWGATAANLSLYHKFLHFNPRTHVGCDGAGPGVDPDHLISIHAPTWGATRCEGVLCLCVGISIHAPTWGATYLRSRGYEVDVRFQSTHPRGVRL